ncbi:MAG: hypothetical protein KIT62_10780 [Cyclobacteriaceae bacterium]|nr:hypothetical protein [Cyclobacteriaceae bacterium]
MRSRINIILLTLPYLLLGIGQVWLYFIRESFPDLFDRLEYAKAGWNESHLILIVGTILLIQATIILFQTAPEFWWTKIGATLNYIGICLLTGQYAIDLLLQPLLTSSQDPKGLYDILKSSALVNLLFYDLVALLWFGQLFIAIGIIRSKLTQLRMPMGIYMLGLILLLVGGAIHPIISRVSYFILAAGMLLTGVRLQKQD